MFKSVFLFLLSCFLFLNFLSYPEQVSAQVCEVGATCSDKCEVAWIDCRQACLGSSNCLATCDNQKQNCLACCVAPPPPSEGSCTLSPTVSANSVTGTATVNAASGVNVTTVDWRVDSASVRSGGTTETFNDIAPGGHNLGITVNFSNGTSTTCGTTFTISDGSSSGGGVPGAKENVNTTPYCQREANKNSKECAKPEGGGQFCDGKNGINTAIGCIPIDIGQFIGRLITYSYGIGGGIALLLMIVGAFQMITSAGNPEQIKKGRDQFIAAGSGLLFIVLSALLLNIIGIHILAIPGF